MEATTVIFICKMFTSILATTFFNSFLFSDASGDGIQILKRTFMRWLFYHCFTTDGTINFQGLSGFESRAMAKL